MTLEIPKEILRQIHDHGSEAYPEEGAGLLFGHVRGKRRQVKAIFPQNNAREEKARRTRYLIEAEDMFKGEEEATRLGLAVIGVFHSHPDHSNQPSEFDREWAMPWFSYVITSVQSGEDESSRSWRLLDDRSRFVEEEILITSEVAQTNSQR